MRCIVALVLGLASGAAIALEDAEVVRAILRVPEVLRAPGLDAVVEIERKADVVHALARSWMLADAAQQANLLWFICELASSKVPSRQMYYRISDAKVGQALLDALDSPRADVRSMAAILLNRHVEDEFLQSHADEMIEFVRKHRNLDAILLLGRTGRPEARKLLASDPQFLSYSRDQVLLASAKLGDAEVEASLLTTFGRTANAEEKAHFADKIGYIGSVEAIKALAAEMRTPEIVRAGADYSLRVFMIRALSKALPKQELFWDPEKWPTDDSYYRRIEDWLAEAYKITWEQPRPPFFYAMAVPGRPAP